MTTGGFLSQLAGLAGILAAALVFCWLARALWAEIGPMVRLLFRRAAPAKRGDERADPLRGG